MPNYRVKELHKHSISATKTTLQMTLGIGTLYPRYRHTIPMVYPCPVFLGFETEG
jgi:hypothetical protein